MDDLSGLDWPSSPDGVNNAPSYKGLPSAFTASHPSTHVSGSTGGATQNHTHRLAKEKAPANDGFSNLVSFSSTSSNKNLSLQEQQKLLQEQKAQQQVAKNQQLDALYNGGDEVFWNKLGSGRSTPAPTGQQLGSSGVQLPESSTTFQKGDLPNGDSAQKNNFDDVDILAAFDANTPVDSSTHFPKPSEPASVANRESQRTRSSVPSPERTGGRSIAQSRNALIDNDPFGLAELSAEDPSKAQPMSQDAEEDDDVLGLLGKPASEVSRSRPTASPSATVTGNIHGVGQDQALAELVEMGFSAEKAREALENTDSGRDVQQAVTWLLNQAHSEARERAGQGEVSKHRPPRGRDPRVRKEGDSRPRSQRPEVHDPVWSNAKSREGRSISRASPASDHPEKDSAQLASEFGSTFLKTAGTFWKVSTKKVQQAVQDLNSDSDSSQPKWMRDPGTSHDGLKSENGPVVGDPPRKRPQALAKAKPQSVTDEALLLESSKPQAPPRGRPGQQDIPRDSRTPVQASKAGSTGLPIRGEKEPSAQEASPRQQNILPLGMVDPRKTLNRHATEEQASQAYVSSSRRRRPDPRPGIVASEPDLLRSIRQNKSHLETAVSTSARPTEKSHFPSPAPLNLAISSREIPSISTNTLRASHVSREAGNEHFKRGDYSAAQGSYTTSLRHLPTNHPITIILYTNRALTSLKTGDPKAAISDSEDALSVIGASRGEGEVIDLMNGETPKLMRDYYGKALMRKAEALEQIERWKEAALVWKEAVERGHGGATSIQGRIRCEKAASPQRQERAAPRSVNIKTPSTQTRSAVFEVPDAKNHIPQAVAVNKLRAANAAAERVDDERFALADTVDARLAAWKDGKADNLRALLGSLDTVLWTEAGWKKISMAELVLPSKVKVQYMKGIGKVHPDKIPTTATTEQRMIAAAVFSTLNEAWDKFKAENGL